MVVILYSKLIGAPTLKILQNKGIITMTAVFLIALSFFLSISGFCQDPADSITEAELRDHVYFLASDEMGGRVVYDPQYRIVVDYAVSQFRAAGLLPLFSDQNGRPSYLQEVPLVKRSVSPKSPFHVATPTKTHGFDPLKDIAYFFYKNLDVFKKDLPVVFIGYGIHDPESGWNDFEGVDLKGKIAVVLPGAPLKDGKRVLSEKAHSDFNTNHPILRFLNKYDSVSKLKSKPEALLIITDDIMNRRWKSFGAAYKGFGVYRASQAAKGQEDISFDTILISRKVADVLLENGPIKSRELKGVSIRLDQGYDIEPFMSWNVAGLVKGTDPEMNKEHIVVGGHLDHVPPSRGLVCNGADDNASGSAGVIEIGEAMAMNPPKRSVIFALWTGEEPVRGDSVMGSKHFLLNSPVPLDQIRMNINLDMIGRTSPKNTKERTHIIGASEELLPGVTRIVKEVNQRTINWPISYEFLGSSDHMSFINQGIPGLMFYSGRHKDLHRPTDDAEKIDFEKMEKISRLAFFLARDLANLEEFPSF